MYRQTTSLTVNNTATNKHKRNNRHQHRRAHEYEASSAKQTALYMATGIKIKNKGYLEELP